jgi:putative spermidine/putrescine transport system ATP-binding protein
MPTETREVMQPSNAQTTSPEPIISVRGLHVAYGAHDVLKGIDLTIAPGSFVALLGASGCGKTTLLRTLSGFTEARSGSITVKGRDILREPPERRDMAMVFQSYALWSHMTVAQNMAYGLKLRRVPRVKIQARIEELLKMLGLQGYGDRSVTQLSGGQRQRVALGRALAIDPQILLLDEPLSNLDARIRLQMRHEIRSIQRQLGVTAILVTHDREEAMVMADQVVILDQGKVAQVGTPEQVYQQPASPYVASFMGAENIVDCEAAPNGDGSLLQIARLPQEPVAIAARYHGPVQVHFRSERAALHAPDAAPADNLRMPGTVTQASYLGGSYRCSVDTPCGAFFIDHPASLATGNNVTICVPSHALHVYPRNPQRAAVAVH